MKAVSSSSRGTPDINPSRIHTASGILNRQCASATAHVVSNSSTAEYNWMNGRANTAGGAMRLVSNQKNKCLSPRNR